MTFTRLLATAALAGALGTSAVLAGSHADPAAAAAVKARQAHMQLYAYNLGILGGMARGNADYDAEAASTAATNLASLASMNTRSYWLPGTSNAEMEGTRALPAIWESGSEVGAKAAALAEAAAAMSQVAGNGLEALQGAMGPLGGACGSCHESYRQPNN